MTLAACGGADLFIHNGMDGGRDGGGKVDAGLDGGRKYGGVRADAGSDGGFDAGHDDGRLLEDGGIPCGLVTCASAQATCGPIGDGCTGVIQCGSCPVPQTCGGGGVPSQCGGSMQCVPRTCPAGITCGQIGDGCGGTVDCGSCVAPDTCGGGATVGQCGHSPFNFIDGGCVPRTCADVGATCGKVSDGCGGLTIDCGTCQAPQTCGGGGVPYHCGGNSACVPRTCAQAGVTCGRAADGCGGLTADCGSCVAPEKCGGGGVPSQCGGGVNTCVPRTCAQAGATCGKVADGCGGLTADCGSCTAPQTCGGGGVPSQCGGGVNTCVPRSCAQAGALCGKVADGCGGLTPECGTCNFPETCGGGGVPSHCGGGVTTCQPRSCGDLGKNCGPVGDGCGGLIPSCGSCGTDPYFICGGSGVPNVCGNGDGGVPCTNLCLHQTTCPSGSTTITGTVRAPTDPNLGFGQPDPIPNALVYVPNAPVANFSAGVSCDRCGAPASGSPLISTTSAADGTFTLTNVPCGVPVPVVIQLGRWRRQVTIPAVQCCSTTALTTEQTRLPRTKTEGDIPLIAVITGNADPMECVLRKMGIDATEFTAPSGGGRVRFYQDNGVDLSGGIPGASTLWDDPNELAKYDVVITDCVGDEFGKSPEQRQNIVNWTSAGGRFFTSHFGYVWLAGQPPFSSTANWNPNQGTPNPETRTAIIDTSFAKGVTFSQWLQAVGASSVPGQIDVQYTRHDFDGVIAPAQRWLYYQDGNAKRPLQYSFNTPVGVASDQQCGRVLYSDYHVNTGGLGVGTFPTSCKSAAPMSAQEKVLEFMLFDLSSCISTDKPQPPTCTPKSCTEQGFTCGKQGDGCGGILSCGDCSPPQFCGGGGVAGVCGSVACAPKSCAQQGLQCGAATDGCGHTLDCGTCDPGLFCGGGGTRGVCGAVPCVPLSCAQQGLHCGQATDGCGNLLPSCGTCPDGTFCGAGGTPGVCAPTSCSPRTCAQLGLNCGSAGNGCGGTQECGTCPPGTFCGGGGVPGVCGGVQCIPTSCAAQSIQCGLAGDGCGGTQSCGQCPGNLVCGAGGPGLCGPASCVPQTCAAQGLSCGPAGDGCGNVIDCGSCTAPDTCGGDGTPGVCGHPTCTPITCAALQADCGIIGDGCGGRIDCGECKVPMTCGGNGVPNQCGGIN